MVFFYDVLGFLKVFLILLLELEVALKYHEMVKKLNGAWISSSDVEVDFSEIIKMIKETNCEVYVGSDSNPSKIPHTLAVSIAVIKKRHFAKYFYVRWNPWGTKKPDMRTRLVDEVVTSCHVAMKIKNEINHENKY